jgi:hypothetical protein
MLESLAASCAERSSQAAHRKIAAQKTLGTEALHGTRIQAALWHEQRHGPGGTLPLWVPAWRSGGTPRGKGFPRPSCKRRSTFRLDKQSVATMATRSQSVAAASPATVAQTKSLGDASLSRPTCPKVLRGRQPAIQNRHAIGTVPRRMRSCGRSY